MGTSGILPITSLPASPGAFVGLQDAVGTCCISPDGLHVPDTEAARAYLSSYVGSAQELAWAKSNVVGNGVLDQLAVSYLEKYAAGFNYVGPDAVMRTFQIDPQSQFNIDVQANASLGSILNGESWDANSFFIAADNSHMLTPTAPDMRTFALAARSYVAALILNNRALKDQINATQDLATLNAIDINAGWPDNG